MSLAQITIRWFLALTLLLSGGAVVVASATYLYLKPKLPAAEELRDVRLQTPLRIFTRDGTLIGEYGEKRRTPLNLEQVPELFIKAILAAEDDRFFEHHGVDIKGLLRATSQLLTTGHIQSGGSTITMQVAKNYFLSQEKTFSRKFTEILLALQIEQELSKEEILELYINKIFLGHRAYGIEAAAQVYYGRSIEQLTLAELAMIAGLPKAPSAYNPITNPDRAITRRNWILARMHQLGYIDKIDYLSAKSSPVTASYHGAKLNPSAAYVAEMARQELLNRFGLDAYTEGYRAYITIDNALQTAAQEAVRDGLIAYDQRHGYRGPEAHIAASGDNPKVTWQARLRDAREYQGLMPAIVTNVDTQQLNILLPNGEETQLGWTQGLATLRYQVDEDRRQPPESRIDHRFTPGDMIRVQQDSQGQWQISQLPQAQASLISLEADTGAILSLVGGFDFNHSKFNRVTQAQRQPGSNFKPFIYTAALANGFTAASIINDAPIVFDSDQLEDAWRPTNDGGRFEGPMRLRTALYRSRNLVSIRLLRENGIENTLDYIERFGFDRAQLPRNLSLALGSHAITPLELIRGYAVFANGGYRVEPYLLERVESMDGQVVYQAQPRVVCRSCDPALQANPATEETEENLDLRSLLGEAHVQPNTAERVLEPRLAFIIDSILRDVIQKGTGRRAQTLKRSDAAGKTGTTNGPADAWFSGYSGGIVTTAWVGFDDNRLLGRREYGGSAALPIWIDYMKAALIDRPERTPPQPPGLVSVRIDPLTGKLAQPGAQEAIFEWFRSEYAPQSNGPERINQTHDSDNASGTLPQDIF